MSSTRVPLRNVGRRWNRVVEVSPTLRETVKLIRMGLVAGYGYVEIAEILEHKRPAATRVLRAEETGSLNRTRPYVPQPTRR